MQQANDLIVLNIREYLENDDGRLGEDNLLQFLSGFSCPLNLQRNIRQLHIYSTSILDGASAFISI